MPFPHRVSHYLQMETIALIAFPSEKKKINKKDSSIEPIFFHLASKKKKKKKKEKNSRSTIENRNTFLHIRVHRLSRLQITEPHAIMEAATARNANKQSRGNASAPPPFPPSPSLSIKMLNHAFQGITL